MFRFVNLRRVFALNSGQLIAQAGWRLFQLGQFGQTANSSTHPKGREIRVIKATGHSATEPPSVLGSLKVLEFCARLRGSLDFAHHAGYTGRNGKAKTMQISKRDYFAAHALTGILGRTGGTLAGLNVHDNAAAEAFLYADAMLKLSKTLLDPVEIDPDELGKEEEARNKSEGAPE